MLQGQQPDPADDRNAFQWAPTLGGECYQCIQGYRTYETDTFQWAPTLGGECYGETQDIPEEVFTR